MIPTPEKTIELLKTCADSWTDPDYCDVSCPFRGTKRACDDSLMEHAAEVIASLLLQNESLKAERDALYEHMKAEGNCMHCKHKDCSEDCDGYCPECLVQDQCPCYGCTTTNNHWEWEGVLQNAP